MIEITREIPDVNVLLALAPEELAAKLLFVMRKRMEDPQQRTMAGMARSSISALSRAICGTQAPQRRRALAKNRRKLIWPLLRHGHGCKHRDCSFLRRMTTRVTDGPDPMLLSIPNISRSC
jgi:hypothetical protein